MHAAPIDLRWHAWGIPLCNCSTLIFSKHQKDRDTVARLSDLTIPWSGPMVPWKPRRLGLQADVTRSEQGKADGYRRTTGAFRVGSPGCSQTGCGEASHGKACYQRTRT